jgi:bacteriocin biosynthesis cyclodehydratase domain-containing protein
MSENKTLRLKKQYSLVAHSPDQVELRHGVWNAISLMITDDSKSGYLFRLLSRLDGASSAEEIARDENVPQEEIEALLDHLVGMGLVENGPGTAIDYYLDSVVPWRTTTEVQGNRPIIFLGDADLAIEIQRYLRDALAGIEMIVPPSDDETWAALTDADNSWLSDGLLFHEKLIAFEAWRDAFIVYATKVINPVHLRALNRVCLEYQIPWLHAAIDGPFLLVGPIIVPHRSACYECLETRVTMNLRENASYQQYKRALVERQVREGQLPLEPAIVGLLASHSALEILNFSLTGSSFTVNKILAIHLPTMEFAFNEVLRAPTCTACGSVPERDDTELYFDMASLLKR